MSQAEGLTEASARELADAACKRAGIDGANAELIRIGSNAVFRLPDHVILRVGRERNGFDEARRQVDVARWLASEEFPANRALNIPQPVDASGHPATFWESVSEEEKYAPIADVARIIRDLHELRAPATLELTTKNPFAEVENRLSEARSLILLHRGVGVGELHGIGGGALHGCRNLRRLSTFARKLSPQLVDLVVSACPVLSV